MGVSAQMPPRNCAQGDPVASFASHMFLSCLRAHFTTVLPGRLGQAQQRHEVLFLGIHFGTLTKSADWGWPQTVTLSVSLCAR